LARQVNDSAPLVGRQQAFNNLDQGSFAPTDALRYAALRRLGAPCALQLAMSPTHGARLIPKSDLHATSFEQGLP
jgi:hypothetical protein